MPTTSNAVAPRVFDRPLVRRPVDLLFGNAPRPVECGLGLVIGAGQVHPEINFTLGPMLIGRETWGRVRETYDRLMIELLERARRLQISGLAVEFEHLPPMTQVAAWGAELTELISGHLHRAHDRWGLRAALRVTIVDLRDESHPPRRRGGKPLQQMLAALNACAAAGADMLSIESTGGKELHDAALTRGDLAGIAYALGVLAPRDMAWLWDRIAAVANDHGIIAAGDSACAFANTAMQLAEQDMLPDVLAALVRAMSAVRSLVAFERGAVGPSKDCAYEGPILKAITGCPISMEGRSASCAHLSPVGNVAAVAADLWSNESTPDVRLLSGSAAVAALESLVYDCRLMNTALATGNAHVLRDLHADSDAPLSAQACLLTPDATIALADTVTGETEPYRRVHAVARAALNYLRLRVGDRTLRLPARELRWLGRLEAACDALPDDADDLKPSVAGYCERFDPSEYGLA